MAADESSDEDREQDTEKQDNEHRQHSNAREEKSEDRRQNSDKLHFRDWIALIAAALQTAFLPVLILLGVLFILAIIVSILFPFPF